MALVKDLIDSVLFPNREVHSIPVLDGALSPNNRLDAARSLGEPFQSPDDLAMDASQNLYVSTQDVILRCTGPNFAQREIFARLPGSVGGLACSPDGQVFACVSGVGVIALSSDGRVHRTIDQAAGVPIRCPTAVTIGPDGTVFITDGSLAHATSDWLPDLMETLPPSGRLIAVDPAGAVRLLADRLNWPGGVEIARGGAEVLVTETWAHRLLAVSLAAGKQRVLVKNFAGYPARISADGTGGYWAAFFGMRTQLIEFVLREREYCKAMMARIPQELWIAPSLGGTFDYREPTQIGRIKKLGIQKPWAPPRSYGLVARLDSGGSASESLHSRVDGVMHGVTAVRQFQDRTLAVLKGAGLLVELPTIHTTNLQR
jgi:sugar lactone lactonase YvrE